MPVARNYTGGSIVYFQGDLGDDIYVLQQGKVVLISTALDSGEEVKEEVKVGEFFGVKSSLGHYPREETAQVIGKTAIIVFKATEFEAMTLKNTRLIMTMMRVFSKQLRDIHRQVREILKAGVAGNPSFELLNVAESFYRGGNIEHAIYAFQKYLEYNPNGKNVARAEEMMQNAKKGLSYPIGTAPPEPEEGAEQTMRLTDEQKMLAADDALGDLSSVEASAQQTSKTSIASVYQDGKQLLDSGNHEGALKKFEECLQFGHLSNEKEKQTFEHAHFHKGVSLVRLQRFSEASDLFSEYIKKYPTGEYIKSCIHQLGLVAEAQGNTDRAKSLYRKVATMPPPDDLTREARTRLEKLGA